MRSCLFTDKPPGLLGHYGPGYSILYAELAVARQGLLKYWEWNQTISANRLQLDEEEIVRRAEQNIGSSRPDTLPFYTPYPFSSLQDVTGPALPINPRTGMGRWMPRALRMEWGNLTEERQESFITALMHLLQGLIPTEHRASFRTIRQGCDAQRCKELHFLEPAKIEQFAHIGRALNMFQTLPPTLTNLSYAPIKFHLNYTAAGNSVDRDFMPYSVCISIRNATVPWRQEAAMYNLLGKLTPTLLGAVVSPLIGKPYVLGVDGRSQRNSTWLLRIHGKVAEWIFATGKISLSEDMPLENQICFEEQYPDQLMYCSQCTNWGHHKEIEGGLAGCSAPGTCSYCGQNTSRSFYKQHELECKKTLDSIKCVHCKTQADFYHDPSKPGNCPVSHCNLLAKLKKLEARQESYNIHFPSEIT